MPFFENYFELNIKILIGCKVEHVGYNYCSMKLVFTMRDAHVNFCYFLFCKWLFFNLNLIISILKIFFAIFFFVNFERIWRSNKMTYKLLILHTSLSLLIIVDCNSFFFSKLGLPSCDRPLKSKSRNLQETQLLGKLVYYMSPL